MRRLIVTVPFQDSWAREWFSSEHRWHTDNCGGLRIWNTRTRETVMSYAAGQWRRAYWEEL